MPRATRAVEAAPPRAVLCQQRVCRRQKKRRAGFPPRAQSLRLIIRQWRRLHLGSRTGSRASGVSSGRSGRTGSRSSRRTSVRSSRSGSRTSVRSSRGGVRSGRRSGISGLVASRERESGAGDGDSENDLAHLWYSLNSEWIHARCLASVSGWPTWRAATSGKPTAGVDFTGQIISWCVRCKR